MEDARVHVKGEGRAKRSFGGEGAFEDGRPRGVRRMYSSPVGVSASGGSRLAAAFAPLCVPVFPVCTSWAACVERRACCTFPPVH